MLLFNLAAVDLLPLTLLVDCALNWGKLSCIEFLPPRLWVPGLCEEMPTVSLEKGFGGLKDAGYILEQEKCCATVLPLVGTLICSKVTACVCVLCIGTCTVP